MNEFCVNRLKKTENRFSDVKMIRRTEMRTFIILSTKHFSSYRLLSRGFFFFLVDIFRPDLNRKNFLMFVLSINHTPLRRYINIDNLSTLLMKHSKFAKPGRPSYFEYTSVFPNCTILRKNFVCSRNTREFSLQVVVTSLKTVLNPNNLKQNNYTSLLFRFV